MVFLCLCCVFHQKEENKQANVGQNGGMHPLRLLFRLISSEFRGLIRPTSVQVNFTVGLLGKNQMRFFLLFLPYVMRACLSDQQQYFLWFLPFGRCTYQSASGGQLSKQTGILRQEVTSITLFGCASSQGNLSQRVTIQQGLCCSFAHVCMLSCSVMSDSLQPYGLQPTRLLCPWNSPGKNTGVGCHCLLQGIFLTQGLNSSPFLDGRWSLYHCTTWEGPCCSSSAEKYHSITTCFVSYIIRFVTRSFLNTPFSPHHPYLPLVQLKSLLSQAIFENELAESCEACILSPFPEKPLNPQLLIFNFPFSTRFIEAFQSNFQGQGLQVTHVKTLTGK